jgi:hypothetical protein
MQSLSARVEKLEKQNKLFKRAALALLLLPAAFVVMGQAKPDRNIDADTVKVGAINARMIYANMVELRDEQNGTTTVLLPGFMTVGTKDKGFASINVLDGPSLSLTDKEGFQAVLGVSSLVTPRTGETHQTSAASLVLFDKDKSVLWSAPR